MELLSWNVNGFRASVRKGFYDFLTERSPDIIALQEIKMDFEPEHDTDYHLFWNPAEKKGYSGTGIFTRKKPIGATTGVSDFNSEGRVQTLEFEKFYFVNAYFPNSGRGLKRLEVKMEFNRAFAEHLNKLHQDKPVVSCGDWNVAHTEQDIARPKQNVKNAGFTPEEREWMSNFLEGGWTDTFRRLHPKSEEYSWWTYRYNARKKDIGWRIDYFVVSEDFMGRVKKAYILGDVMGSDHAPVELEVDL